MKKTMIFLISGKDWPTHAPTKHPTPSPTKPPTKDPTRAPTEKPTKAPTKAPTAFPTPIPTSRPTKRPSYKGEKCYFVAKKRCPSQQLLRIAPAFFVASAAVQECVGWVAGIRLPYMVLLALAVSLFATAVIHITRREAGAGIFPVGAALLQ
eukprot:jgi/Bigna1/84109/fgenesh1_pg.123_\